MTDPTDARERLEALAKGPPDHIPLHPYTAATYGDLRSILSQPLAGREQVDQMVDDFVADLDSARLRDRILSLLSPGAPVNTTAASCSESGENRTSGAPEGWREAAWLTDAELRSSVAVGLQDRRPENWTHDEALELVGLVLDLAHARAALTSSSAKPGGEEQPDCAGACRVNLEVSRHVETNRRLREGLDLPISWELSWGEVSDEEGADCGWRVHERSGNRSDREWTLIATGETPIEALIQARRGHG